MLIDLGCFLGFVNSVGAGFCFVLVWFAAWICGCFVFLVVVGLVVGLWVLCGGGCCC